MKKIILFLLAGLLSLSTMKAQIDYTKAVGKTEGHYSVSETGAAVYEIPIYVPPGVKGMEPQLSLVYNSQSASGIAGKGWSLSSLGSITRQPRTIQTNGKATNIRFDSEDLFVWNGNAFISRGNTENLQFNKMEKSDWKGGALIPTGSNEYRTEIESFCKIISVGNADNPSEFIVYTKDGTSMHFSATDGTYGYGYNKTFAWNLSQITDEDENAINFSYESYSIGSRGNTYLTSIEYAGGTNKIAFEYATESPCITSYFLGKEIKTDKLLKNIKIISNHVAIRRYSFEYNFVNKVPYLQKITEYGLNNEALNSTLFEWIEDISLLTDKYEHKSHDISQFTFSNHSSDRWELGHDVRFLADVDADGEDELLGIRKKNAETKSILWVAKKDNAGVFELKDSVPLTSVRGEAYAIDPYGYRVEAVDVNGDGRADIVQFGGEGVDVVLATEGNSYESQTKKWSDDGVLKAGTHKPRNNCFFADVNGDKLPDIVYLGSGGLYNQVFLSTGSKFERVNWPVSSGTIYGNYSTTSLQKYVFVCDVNGDGLDDIVIFPMGPQTSTDKMTVLVSTGEGFDIKNISINPAYFVKDETEISRMPVFMVDINGDGLADMVSVCDGSNKGIWVSFSRGDGTFTTVANWYSASNDNADQDMYNRMLKRNNDDFRTPRIFMDIDGDGLTDLLRLVDNTIYVARNTGNEFVYQGFTYPENSSFFDPDIHLRLYGDINGDGITDILLLKRDQLTYSTLNVRNTLKIKKITDGFKSTTAFVYNVAKDVAMYSNEPSYNTFPFRAYRKGLFITSKVYFTDEERTQYAETFKYTDPILHLHGRGFLGFKQIISQNEKTQRVCISENNFYREKAILYPYSQSFRTHLTEDDNSTESKFETVGLGNGRFWLKKLWEKTTSFTDNTIQKKSYTYNSDGNVTKETLQVSLSTSPDNIKYTEETIIDYENTDFWNFKPTFITNKRWMGNETPISRATKFSYDGHRLIEKITDAYDRTYKLVQRINAYDSYGNPTSISQISLSGEERTHLYEYDNTGRFLTKQTNPLGHVYRYEYHPNFGKLAKETDPNDLATTYQYDNWGRLKTTFYPDGNKEEQRIYWAQNTRVPNAVYYTEKGMEGEPPVYSFKDIYGREVCSYTFHGRFPSSDNIYVDTRYNNQGLVAKKSLPYSRILTWDIDKEWVEYTYDSRERLLTETGPYIDKRYTYQFTNGINKITLTDALSGNTCVTEYNAMGWPVKVADASGTLVYTYNAMGFPVKINANGIETDIVYDILGNKLRVDNPNWGYTASGYNSFGEQMWFENRNSGGQLTEFKYDLLGRIKQRIRYDIGYNRFYTDYTYDEGRKAIGKISTINGSSTSQFQYDDLGRLAEETETVKPEGQPESEYITRYTYGEKSKLARMEYPSGFYTDYQYDTWGNLSRIIDPESNTLWQLRDVDKYGQVREYFWGAQHVRYLNCNSSGKVVEIHNGLRREQGSALRPPVYPVAMSSGINNVFASADNQVMAAAPGSLYGYSPGVSDRPRTVFPPEEQYSCYNEIQYCVYDYNNRGLLETSRCLRSGQEEHFGYDPANRLKRVWNGYYDRFINYNVAGNITAKTDVGNYSYRPGRPHALYILEASEEGNRLEIPMETCNVTYNHLNRVAGIYEEGKQYSLQYGNQEQRNYMEETVNGQLTRKIIPNAVYEEKYDAEGGKTNLHYITAYGRNIGIYVTSGGEPLGEMYYTHTDRLGSYAAITNFNGDVIEQLSYDAWGYRRNPDNWAVYEDIGTHHFFDRGFTGHEHLDQFGLINMNARLYDPIVGQFFSPDELAGQYPHLSPYSYCGNDPVNYVDPTGNEYTHYVDKNYNSILHTNDGSDAVVMIPDEQIAAFKKHIRFTDKGILNSKGWNDYWKDEFGLAKTQFNEDQIGILNMFNSTWARNNAVDFMLKPTAGNLFMLSLSEALSQWTNPELVVVGMSVGVAGAGALNVAKMEGNVFKHSYKYADRVRMRAAQDPVSHNFPYSFDDAILATKPISQKNGYQIFQLNGTMNGKNGIFEIGLTKDGVIDHRFFRPFK